MRRNSKHWRRISWRNFRWKNTVRFLLCSMNRQVPWMISVQFTENWYLLWLPDHLPDSIAYCRARKRNQERNREAVRFRWWENQCLLIWRRNYIICCQQDRKQRQRSWFLKPVILNTVIMVTGLIWMWSSTREGSQESCTAMYRRNAQSLLRRQRRLWTILIIIWNVSMHHHCLPL